eukprot:CAMPEP_0174972540 /NCGR_PEP_ID=MMETSP0004_2-20121128/10687_1 /TAXON_ID=420556 /ORGANISM="Ochromonas sp., Strain CCMP1393" /LENGTH=362 /DNA_ID=CAMNT_0016222777 /DNA_START=158 /DNA_END=1246 /DNA_ORIENTATION=+
MVFNMFSSSSKGKISSNKKLCVVTGTSSGLGKETARSLIESGDYHVVCGVRDTEKMKAIAEEYGFDKNSYSILPLDLASFDSTRQFVSKLKSLKGSRPLDSLCCNAAVYQPSLSYPKYTGDDIEEQLQINHLSHFLLCSLLINDVKKGKDPRIVIVGSITGNSNTIGGGAVLPLADLGDLQGLQAGGRKPVAMIDGLAFNGAKSYKDSKICNMMTINELHSRYHDSTGITFSSMYPGCIAETNLFREKREWFRTLFPLFMKYVTGGYVSEREAGDRLAQVIAAPECKKSGVYWSWNGGARQLPVKDFKKGTISGTGGAGGSIFENTPSDQVADRTKSGLMWDYSSKITDAKWPAVSKKRELV